MVDVSTGMAMIREGRANPLSKITSRAPLDRLVYEEGDMSKLPVVPHALAVRRLLHADSRMLHGRVPANATEKDFIRNGESLRPRDLLEDALKVRPLRQTPRVTTNFGNESSIAAEALQAEIREVQRLASRAGAAKPCGGGCKTNCDCNSPAALSRGIRTDRDLQLLSAGGPSPHPTHVLESEGVRGGRSSAGTIAKMLAQRPDAPISASPAPAHHFMSGGSRSQLKKEMRRAANREKLREANLELRKDQLVARNLELLQGMVAEEREQASTEEAFIAAVAGERGDRRAESGHDDPAALAPQPAPLLVTESGPIPPIRRRIHSAGSAQPAAFLDTTAAKAGMAMVGALVVLVGAGAAVAAAKKRRAKQRR